MGDAGLGEREVTLSKSANAGITRRLVVSGDGTTRSTQSTLRPICCISLPRVISLLKTWEVTRSTRYSYCTWLVSDLIWYIIYLNISFSDNFLLSLSTFLHNYKYFYTPDIVIAPFVFNSHQRIQILLKIIYLFFFCYFFFLCIDFLFDKCLIKNLSSLIEQPSSWLLVGLMSNG